MFGQLLSSFFAPCLLQVVNYQSCCNFIEHTEFGFEKVLFNRKARKVGAKYAKLRHYNSILCDLCVNSLRPLRLLDFNFFNSTSEHEFTLLKLYRSVKISRCTLYQAFELHLEKERGQFVNRYLQRSANRIYR